MPMKEEIALSIVAVAMLLFTADKHEKVSTSITLGLTLAILLWLLESEPVAKIGFAYYMLVSTTIVVIYGISVIRQRTVTGVFITLMGLWTMVYYAFIIMHWPYLSEVQLSLIIPFILYCTGLLKKLFRKSEYGFLTILVFMHLMNFMHLWS